ncbi:VOC family protein [Cryobacterium psychrophilum]|uniref:VOC family protein n=1 Tax=Cryobacterium psychrophilum TaxID=41988 RepID=A0A4R8AEC7_9MICO|nr:VOC family protein [Cryobacterium psychrophilum]TDW28391.1 glyoxylase I family protein [Cryobacterium psychrophilum]TDW29503.1 glyoxylase I family protein [Cryobacterium psychrophilum]TFD79387.1 VOC family protein [Cryobacterium psychrophilum]
MGIPGLRGTEHIGFTVPDLDEADDFFVRVIGCDRIYTLGPYRDDAGTWMADHLNVHPRTVMRELRFYRCGTGPNFEVFQYDAADEQRPQPRNSDLGGHHLGFYVDDLDAALEHLRSNNIRILGEPTSSSRYSEGQRWVYFLSPWGMQFELVSFPNGKAYEKDAPVLLWHPLRPGE